MNIRSSNIEIVKSNPFANCKLGREKYADILTELISENEEGFVMAINNSWGAGKTTFLEMWSQKLKNKGYKTINFNSWENDFEDNPFLAITSELKIELESPDRPKMDSFLEKAGKITKSVLPTVIKTIIKNKLGLDESEIADKLSESTLDLINSEIKDYHDRKKEVKEFKSALEMLIINNVPKKPLIFIIDELDRCRPNYAVELLENIKHLFSVKGIVFVLAIDKIQLGHAICGVYGNPNIDSQEYLRRFIEIEYEIPDPDIDSFIEHLAQKNSFDRFTDSKQITNLIELGKILFRNTDFSLRQIDQIFNHASLAMRTNDKPEGLGVILFLVYLKHTNLGVYDPIKSKSLNSQELINSISGKIKLKDKGQDQELDPLFQMIAALLMSYSMSTKKTDWFLEIFTKDYPTANTELRIVPKIGLKDEKAILFSHLQHLKHNNKIIRTDLNKWLQQIELTQSFKK